MKVREIMTKNPVIVTKETLLTDALNIMRTNGIRRLPVVDKGKVIDIVTDRDLNTMSASPATSLSVFELNYLLAKTKIKDVLKAIKRDTTELITVKPDDLVDQAAVLMKENKIGGIPVIEGDSLVGIITETDIFSTLIELMGFQEEGYRLILEQTEDKPGVIAQISNVIFNNGGNIKQLMHYTLSEGFERIEIKVQSDNIHEIVEQIKNSGFPVSLEENEKTR